MPQGHASVIMTDIRGSLRKSSRSSPDPKRVERREDGKTVAGTDGVLAFEGRIFHPAIISPNADPYGDVVVRQPKWYVLRYVTGKERFLHLLLNQVALPFRHLTFLHRAHGARKTTERAWLPGHIFVQFDIARDFWQQLLRMPSVIEILGGPSPLPDGLMEDLVGRLPNRVAKASAFSTIPPGQTIRVIRGPVAGFECVVTWSDRRHVKVISMMFGRPTEVILKIEDVLVIG